MKKLYSLMIAVIMILSIVVIPGAAASEIIITVHDEECVFDGTWAESTAEIVKGPTGETSYYGSGKVSFSAANIPQGKYDLYVYNLPVYATPNAVEALVKYKGGEEAVILDYTANPKDWLGIGTYTFSGDSGEGVVFSVHTQSNEKIQRASAVKFVPNNGKEEIKPKKAELVTISDEQKVVSECKEAIVGCQDPGFSKTGSWTDSSLAMPSKQLCWYSFQKGSTATWKPNLAAEDNVTIYYMKAAATEKEDPAAKFEIFAEGKITEKIIDVTKGENGWIELGTFNFAGDNSEYIKLIKETDGSCTRATDLRFAKKSAEEAARDNSVFKGTDKEILERLGMLIGEGSGITADYIKTVPTRIQAAVLVLRLRGLEEEAKKYSASDNFADASDADWAKNIMAYIKAHPEYGMIGVDDGRFAPNDRINAEQYAKILLEALGYKYNTDFTWEQTKSKADSVGIAVNYDGNFTVDDLAQATVSALGLKLNGQKKTLLGSVIEQREGISDDVYLKNAKPLTPEIEAAQTQMRHKARGLIYNDDGNDTYVEYKNYPGDFDISDVTEPITHENFLSKRTDGLEDSQATTIMYCDGVFNSYHHRSSGETTVRKRDWSYMLADTEMDSLETKIDFGKKHNIEVFWSMRMNDCHDSAYQENELDPWKQEHLDWLMSGKNDAVMNLRYGVQYWSAVDYGIPQVRQKVYNILKDTVTRYDIDGIQLDFSRYPIFFKQVCQSGEVWPESIERMTSLIRSIRTMMDQISIERNKPLLLAIYVPDSIDFCKALGLDIKSWMEEGLIDMSGIRTTVAIQSWEDSVKEYSPYDVQVHATFDIYLAKEKGSSPDWNKEAALAYRAGVDGIQLYNNFNPKGALFDTLGSAETCGPVDPSYKSLIKREGNYGMQVKDPQRFMKPIPYSTN